MGDTKNLSLTPGFTGDKYSGDSSIKVIYTTKDGKEGWAGVYWLNAENNWGTEKGVDLTGVSKLTFWAKGATGNEKISEFKVGGVDRDTALKLIGPVTLSNEWKEYTIDLTNLNLKNISGGFCFSISAADNPAGATFFIDDIVFK